jgi:predicted enzyme related to lactoylglutathione lyase
MSMPMHVLTILAVKDLQRAVAFYRDAFEWPARVQTSVYVELELPDGRGIGLYVREAFARNTVQVPVETPAGAITGTELYLRCDDLDVTIARLEASGARLLSAASARAWGDVAAYYADPDGNVVVVSSPLAS